MHNDKPETNAVNRIYKARYALTVDPKQEVKHCNHLNWQDAKNSKNES